MKKRHSRRLKHIISVIALTSLYACSSGESSLDNAGDGPVIIGTGMTLDGTTTSNKTFASNTVQMRSQSGDRLTATFDTQGRFSFDGVEAGRSSLIRSDLGNGNYLYGVATNTTEDGTVQNIHSYSDAVVRNWYTSRALDVDAIFESADANAAMPTSADTSAIYEALTAVVSEVIANYDLSGVNLNEVEFAANGAGVDQFILENPVIYNEGSITIIIFDPDNQTQSVAAEDVSLSTELNAADTQAPSAPTELRALPSAIDEITLVWDVASDNIGIANYAVYRDSQEIGTTPYPVFVDGGLASGSQFSYSVIAIDATGNQSSASLVVSAEPLASVDTTPPGTPSSVLIDTRRGSLDLTWTQTGISDVASFAISRGTEPTNLPSYTNVTSTFLFDEAVNAGVQYCYQISAVDASGNASEPTAVVCGNAPGTVVSGGSSTPSTPTQPVNQPTGDTLTAPQVDVSTLACTNEIAESTIETAVTLSAGCYLAPDGILIDEPGNLTLNPGVVIKFGSSEYLRVSDGASLTARGTAADPIVLTGRDASPGHWNGVEFRYSNSANNVLDHVQVEYAGIATNDTGGISFLSNTSNPARASISNSTIRFNSGPGISIPEEVPLSSFDGNRITGNSLPVLTHGTRVDLLDKRSSYTGNTLDAIMVTNSTLESSITWPKLPVPYHADDIDVEGVFTVEAGTQIFFENDSGITVDSDGTLVLNGTQSDPILLSGLSARKGGWHGIDFFYSDNDNRMDYVTVEYAGGGSGNAAIRMRSNGSNLSRVGFDNITITNSTGYAIEAEITALFTLFKNVTLTSNDALANVGIYTAQAFNSAGNYSGNTVDAIELKNADVDDGAVVLSNADIPYFAGNIDVDDTLTLEAGVSLLMGASATFKINGDAALTSNGTATNPVSIVGQQSLAGFWNGLHYVYSNSPLNRLTYTVLADGGDGSGGIEEAANARFWCNGSNPSRLTLENSRVENSAGYGLYLQETGCLVTVDAGTTFSTNALGETN